MATPRRPRGALEISPRHHPWVPPGKHVCMCDGHARYVDAIDAFAVRVRQLEAMAVGLSWRLNFQMI